MVLAVLAAAMSQEVLAPVLVAMELFKITEESHRLHLEWVQWNDAEGENCHPLRDPDQRLFTIWPFRVRGVAPIQLLPTWILLATEQVNSELSVLR